MPHRLFRVQIFRGLSPAEMEEEGGASAVGNGEHVGAKSGQLNRHVVTTSAYAIVCEHSNQFSFFVTAQQSISL